MTMAQGLHKPIQPHDDRAIWLGLGVPLGIVAEVNVVEKTLRDFDMWRISCCIFARQRKSYFHPFEWYLNAGKMEKKGKLWFVTNEPLT